MAETIIKGYLFKKINYGVFDEIISFISPNNHKYSCLSKGSKKIESKNGRNLFLGDFIEFEIFESRSEDKLNRLKKAITVDHEDWNIQTLVSFQLLNECTDKTMVIENDLYRFYDENLQLIKANLYDEVTLILIILRKFCQIVGIDLIINQCVFCGNKKLKTISFKHQGMLCNNCSQEFKAMIYDINVSKLFHSLFNNQYAKLSLYHQDHSFAIKLLKNYISDSSGIFLNTLGEY